MTWAEFLATVAGDKLLLYTLLAASAVALVLLAKRAKRIAKSERPDDALSNLAMLVGLGWGSEAIWEITGEARFPTSLRLLLFFVLETVLVVSMIRAKRAMRELGHPGRSGRTAWVVATGMALVAVWVADSFGEALLRLMIPLLITNMWWDGLVGEGARKALGATSWRWTPRRLLLWLGAIEPGERDVEQVHRERLTQQMTRLEFRRRHGSPRQQRRAARRLARLGLVADDAVIDEVRARADRAMWFEPAQEQAPESASPSPVPASRAASARAARVRHRRALRKVRVTHPHTCVTPAQEVRQDDRPTQDVDLVIRAIKQAHPATPQRRIAALAATSEATVRRALRRSKAAEATQQQKEINGNVPELEGASSGTNRS
jgi:hypothetical protein